MTARVLVVDDILSNVKLLEAKLTAEYFEVLTASSGEQALTRVAAELPDIGFEISVLGREREVTSVDEIEVGRHGLIVEHGWNPVLSAIFWLTMLRMRPVSGSTTTTDPL